VGGTAPTQQAFLVGSTGPALPFAVTTAVSANSGGVNWLSAAPTSGNTPANVTVTPDGSKLPAGTYTGTVTVSSLTPNIGNNPATVQVTLVVNSGTISASPTNFVFTQAVGGAAPAPQAIAITAAPPTITYTASVATANGVPWLTATPLNVGAVGSTVRLDVN